MNLFPQKNAQQILILAKVYIYLQFFKNNCHALCPFCVYVHFHHHSPPGNFFWCQMKAMTKIEGDCTKGDYFMLKPCFTSVLVLMDFNLLFMHFSSLWRANDLFSMKIISQPIRADFATIG